MGTLKTNEEIKKEISETMEELSWVVEGGDAHDLQDACDKAHACLADTLALIERLESEVSFYKNISALNAKTCDMQNELIEEIKTDRARISENIKWMEAERDDLKRYIRQLEMEKDAAVADLEHVKDCDSCKYDNACLTGKKDCFSCHEKSCPCMTCQYVWRGVQTKEESNDQ